MKALLQRDRRPRVSYDGNSDVLRKPFMLARLYYSGRGMNMMDIGILYIPIDRSLDYCTKEGLSFTEFHSPSQSGKFKLSFL